MAIAEAERIIHSVNSEQWRDRSALAVLAGGAVATLAWWAWLADLLFQHTRPLIHDLFP